jgi:acetyl-CoA synthetase
LVCWSSDNAIKISGNRIGYFEVKSALMKYPCVLECVITGAADKERGSEVKATVILVKDAKRLPNF